LAKSPVAEIEQEIQLQNQEVTEDTVLSGLPQEAESD
jgi:hypothetical protein